MVAAAGCVDLDGDGGAMAPNHTVRTRGVAGVLAALALAFALAGCSEDGAGPAPPTTSPATVRSAPPTTTPATSPTSSPTPATSAPPVVSTSAPPTSPATSPATPSTSAAPRPDAAALGFGEIAFTVVPAGGGPAAGFCALLAETAAQLSRGLMGRRDLAGYDAMLFRFAADTTAAFYMRNVPVPLSIAWFAADGRFVSSTDMAPCADRDGCPTYGAAGPYRFALEVLAGGLGRLGVGEGAVLAPGGACRR